MSVCIGATVGSEVLQNCVQPHELHQDEISALQLTEDEMKDMRPMLGTGCKAL